MLKETVSGKYTLAAEGAGMYAFPHAYAGELAAMKQVLRVIQAGVNVAEVKGKDIVPAHSLAMSSQLLNRDVFPSEEIGYEQAIAYLRKEVITFPPSAPRGFVLLTYRHIPLGFVKNIGNRANNLYPQEWRIRSGYMPEEVRTL
ncbi:tRNA and rRNA cytosine-C5-methylases [Bacteroides pyogenes JCM 10003]|nr:tRNA and rRNA cytosine-C5-methylases [Bacteroides pyogenes JCM 10003]